MSAFEQELSQRANHQCELCAATEELSSFKVECMQDVGAMDQHAFLCPVCQSQLSGKVALDVEHWQCLSDSAWTQVPVVQVLIHRLLTRLQNESWAADLLEQIYLEESTLVWAQKESLPEADTSVVVDANGTPLQDGDTVSILKNLDVKGSSIVAKRGTAVRNIRLTDDPTHIEGRVNGVSIFLKTCFLKKI